jgi:hypothetical protein
LHHEEVEALERLHHVLLVGVREHGVLAHHEEAAQRAGVHRVEGLRDRQTGLVGKIDAPRLREPLLGGRIADGLIPGVDVGQRAHVAGPLHVVLAAQGVHARAAAAEIAGEQSQVAQREHVLGAV